MGEVQGIAKKEKNLSQNFNYRGIDAVVNKVGPALRNAGGFIVPSVISQTASIATTAKGGSMHVIRLEVQFSVYGSEGDPITGTVAAEAFDSGDKATGKAMSVAFRTFLLQVLALPTDEPDPDTFTYETTGRDWIAEADTLALNYNVEGLRKLYSEAVASRADKDTLEKVKQYGVDASRLQNSAG